MTSGTPQGTPDPSGTKPTLINMVKAVTTRSRTRKTPTDKETEKPQPMEQILDSDTTSNICQNNPKDTSIKEMQSTKPFCKRIVKRLLNKTASKHEMKTFFIHKGLLYRYASDHSKDFCALVIPKAWRYTILVHSIPRYSNSLVSNYRLFRRPPSAPKITPLTQC